MKYNIIQTDKYLLVVDDSEIKEGDYYLSKISNGVFRRSKDGHWIENYDKKMYHKVIAHLPLNNSPILEGVDLLPNIEQEDDVEKLVEQHQKGGYDWQNEKRKSFKEGYNKAKEKYKYTEDDMRKAILLATTSKYDHKLEFHSEEEIIQTLSQPKYPIAFESEMEWHNSYGSPTLQYDAQELKIKTTTNSKSQTILVGKYIY